MRLSWLKAKSQKKIFFFSVLFSTFAICSSIKNPMGDSAHKRIPRNGTIHRRNSVDDIAKRSSIEEAIHKCALSSHAKFALLSTIKDKIEIPKFPVNPLKIKGLPIFPIREKEHEVPMLPPSASARDLRSITGVEKEPVEAVKLARLPPTRAPTLHDESLRGADSETCCGKASTSPCEGLCMQNNASLWKGLFRLWKQKSLRRLSSFPPLGGARLSRWKSGKEINDEVRSDSLGNDLCLFKPSWKTYTISELQNATDNFNQDNLIGKGGFSEVYEGCLDDGQFVAIKRLNEGSVEERTNSFLAELGIMVHINHPNIAKLIGIGVEGDMHLVLALSPNGSLSSLLHGNKGKLEWDLRYKIALGTAEGLEYLHDKCPRRIIHRDIKTANILLTEEFEPQICDFGLAKWLPDELTHHTVSSVEGTFGYLAPEYLTHGIVDEKTDVFAFGVLLLELISGRQALDSSQRSLLMWAKPLIERGEFQELVDPALGDSYNREQLRHVTETASLCIQYSSVLRPRMSEALPMLRGEKESSKPPTSYQKLLRRRTYSEELFDAEEYNATKYLSDLNRHKQIALDF